MAKTFFRTMLYPETPAVACLLFDYLNFRLEGKDIITQQVIKTKCKITCLDFVDIVCEGTDLEGDTALMAISYIDKSVVAIKAFEVVNGQLEEIDPYPRLEAYKTLVSETIEEMVSAIDYLEHILTDPKSPLVQLTKLDGTEGSCAQIVYDNLTRLLKSNSQALSRGAAYLIS